MSRALTTVVLNIVLAVGFVLPAGAQVSDLDREILVDFYLAAGGDEWVRNDGWLDDDVEVCDWYGIDCQFRNEVDRDVLQRIELPANNLTGTLDARIFEIVHTRLDLGDNHLGGELDRLPRSPGQVDLSNNKLSGELPMAMAQQAGEVSGASLPNSIWYLDLSGNDFEGEVPANWTGTIWLSLANNQLEGLPLSLFEQEMHPASARFLDLSDNRFSGSLPDWIMERRFMGHDGPSRWGGGLNLCWNDFGIDNPELIEWIGEHHVGGAGFERCLSTERLQAGPELSGSWFDPARDGEGISIQLLEGGRSLLYWFTFDDEGGQRWLFEVGDVLEQALDWKPLLQTRGHFGQGLAPDDEGPALEVRGSFRLDRTGEQSLQAERVYIDPIQHVCLAIYPPPLSCFGSSISDRLDYQRLTELAGTTCANRSDSQQYAGAWFNPERDGEGFIIEVLPDDRAVVYWFTYQPDGSGQQAWMTGVGQMLLAPIFDPPPPGGQYQFTVTFDPLYQPQGATFGPEFNPADVERVEWGELTIWFFDANTADIEWTSNDPAYGSGSYPIERLAQPMLAECGAE